MGEPTQADLERDYPHWHTWIGIDRMFHGLRSQGAALTARGEDWMDLADQIRRAEVMLEDTRPRCWPVPDPPADPRSSI
jgi:hypothetical protein